MFQQSVASGEDVYKNARKAKAKDYPSKDSEGRRTNPSPCLPFILTSMGGLCSEGHEFLRICRKRNPEKVELMLDVLVTQHSRWTARRIHRALLGQSLIDLSGEFWTCASFQNTNTFKISDRSKQNSHSCKTYILSDFTRQFSSTQSHESPHSMSNDDDWSACSDNEHADSSSSRADDEEFSGQFSRGSGPAIRHVGSSQQSFNCTPAAFPAGSEDPVQSSYTISDPAAATRRTEFFELSPPR